MTDRFFFFFLRRYWCVTWEYRDISPSHVKYDWRTSLQSGIHARVNFTLLLNSKATVVFTCTPFFLLVCVTFDIFCTSENIHLLQETFVFAVVLPCGIEKVSVIEKLTFVLLVLESKVVKNGCQKCLIVSSRDPNPSPIWIPCVRVAQMFQKSLGPRRMI